MIKIFNYESGKYVAKTSSQISVAIVSPFITFLVDLQNLQVPVWKVVIWYLKVQAHLEKVGKLSIMYQRPV
jgi:hypothetical protein